jgi:hypothetical protein
MAYRQYTQCVSIDQFDRAWLGNGKYTQAALLGLKVTLPVGVFTTVLAIAGVATASSWYIALLLAEVWAMASLVGFCYWFLYRRLICLPPPAGSAADHFAVGRLINLEPPDYNFDNDFSIGILPCPLPIGANKDQVAAGSPYGYLIEPQPGWLGSPFGGDLPFQGETASCQGHTEKSAVLHCEFEGRGVYDLYLAAQAALFLAVAALLAFFLPIAGWIVALLAILAVLVLGAGYGIGQLDKPHQTGDDLVPGGFSTKCDEILIVAGHWVYDSYHSGANELHPITFCTKTSCSPKDVIEIKTRWEEAINDATSPATLASQQLPQYQWQVHPLIDGCEPPVIF